MDVSIAPAKTAFSAADLVVVTVADPPKPLSGPVAKADRLLEGVISRAVKGGEITGKAGELTFFHTIAPVDDREFPTRIAVVGIGNGSDHLDWRQAGRAAASTARKLKARDVTFAAATSDGPIEIGAFIDGFGYGAYNFARFKSDDESVEPCLTVAARSALKDDVASAAVVVDAVNAARDLGNAPANHMTPLDLAAHAKDLAADIDGLECEILGEPELKELGAGALLSVARGSELPARMIVLRYSPETVAREEETLGIVGKAISFDTGGISIKPSGGMEEMKLDMAGGAAALEGAALIARLGLPVRVYLRRALGGEHAQRHGDQTRRRGDRDERQNHRGHQHRRRGPARYGRRPGVVGNPRRDPTDRLRHAHRRDRGGAGRGVRGALRQRRAVARPGAARR